MEKLSVYLSSLPSHLVGTQVFSFLSLTCLVKLDSALAEKGKPHALKTALTFCTVNAIDLNQERNVEAWRWCTKRRVIVDKLFINAIKSCDAALMTEMIGLTKAAGTIRWNCDLDYNTFAADYNAQDYGKITAAITQLLLKGSRHDDLLTVLPRWCRQMKRLTAVYVESSIPEVVVCDMLEDCPPLRTISLCDASIDSINMLHFHCDSIVNLRMHFLTQVSAKDMTAMLSECRKLQSVTFTFLIRSLFPESAVLALAASCADLRSLSIRYCMVLADAALTALASGCPHLTELTCGRWGVVSVASVDAVLNLLERMTRLDANCGSTEPTIASMNRALRHLRCMKHLSLANLCAGLVPALCSLSTTYCESLKLQCGPGETVVVDKFVAIAAGQCRRLHTLTINVPTILGSVLLALAELQPCVRVFSSSAMISESTLVNIILTWPHLENFSVNEDLHTDNTIRALVLNCPRLQRLCLTRSTHVTGAALVELIQRCRKLTCLAIPSALSKPDRKLLFEARGPTGGPALLEDAHPLGGVSYH
jgi:hypothetical protein